MFDIRYEDGLGWRVYVNNEPWSPFAHDTEGEAIDELARQYPAAAHEYERLHPNPN